MFRQFQRHRHVSRHDVKFAINVPRTSLQQLKQFPLFRLPVIWLVMNGFCRYPRSAAEDDDRRIVFQNRLCQWIILFKKVRSGLRRFKTEHPFGFIMMKKLNNLSFQLFYGNDVILDRQIRVDRFIHIDRFPEKRNRFNFVAYINLLIHGQFAVGDRFGIAETDAAHRLIRFPVASFAK